MKKGTKRVTNRYIIYSERRLTAIGWAEELKIPVSTIYTRLSRKWSDTECLFGREKTNG